MLTKPDSETPRPETGPAVANGEAGGPVIWGLDVPGLHDRHWASRRIAVVRIGGAAPAPREAELYLLLDHDALVVMSLDRVIDRMRWSHAEVVRVRVADASTSEYRERVVSDENDRFIRIERLYRGLGGPAFRAWLTKERSIAEAWRTAPGRREAVQMLRSRRKRDRILSASVEGSYYTTTDREERHAFLRRLLERWDDPGVVIDGIYQFSNGVWLSEAAKIEEGTRVVPPLWIGDGARLASDHVYVGPGVVSDDAAGQRRAAPIDWSRVELPRWKLQSSTRLSPTRRAGKRLFDICFSLAVLVGTCWIYPIAAAAILIEDGWPIFFAHRRQTLGGRDFPCYKFRTMRRDAEAMKAELAKMNQADGPQFFIREDPRLLRAGKIMRKIQIDELPQFWNVLLGHMSVVGPRPSPDKENQYCPAWRESRLSVRPGITGLWQVKRTREPQTDFQEWIRYDLEYVQHQSWRMDIWIICQTVLRIFGR